VILPWTWSFLVGGKNLPFFEFYIQVLTHLAKDINEHEVIIEISILVFTSETDNSIIFNLISVVRLKFISLDDLMPTDLLIGLCQIVHCENQRIEHVSTSKSNEDEVLVELFFLVDAATDHECTAEESRSMVLDI
jgi:hypothetical protein